MRLTFTVPQGTDLSPSLFLIIVNKDNIPHTKIYKYVDTMTFALTHKQGQSNILLQDALNQVPKWALFTPRNALKLNLVI